MEYVPQAEAVAFMGALAHRFPELMPVLQEHLEDQHGEMLPHILMADVVRWLVARLEERGVDDPILRGVLQAIEEQFGRGDPVDNVIAVSFVENLPYAWEAGHEIRALLGPCLAEQLRLWDGGTATSAMPDSAAFDPRKVYLDLLDGGMAEVIPVTPEFWPELMSGKRDVKGRLTAAFHLAEDIDHWEMHPAGDELLVRLSGVFEVLLEVGGTTRRATLDAATCCCLVPKGAWHTIKVREAGEILFVTPGAGTEHRPA